MDFRIGDRVVWFKDCGTYTKTKKVFGTVLRIWPEKITIKTSDGIHAVLHESLELKSRFKGVVAGKKEIDRKYFTPTFSAKIRDFGIRKISRLIGKHVSHIAHWLDGESRVNTQDPAIKKILKIISIPYSEAFEQYGLTGKERRIA